MSHLFCTPILLYDVTMNGNLPQKLTHHAYVLTGGADVQAELISFLEKKHKIVTQGNPDFVAKDYATFTIDDARELKAQAGTKAASSNAPRTFVIRFDGITVEAQNALLKLLEEPNENTHIFLIVRSVSLLLPTIRSRVQMIGGVEKEEPSRPKVPSNSEGENIQLAKQFIAATPAKRLDIIKKLLDEVSKETKTKQDVISFVDAVEAHLYHSGVDKHIEALKAIQLVRTYLNDRAPSLKMLLEYIALI